MLISLYLYQYCTVSIILAFKVLLFEKYTLAFLFLPLLCHHGACEKSCGKRETTKKMQVLKFTLDCICLVEDEIIFGANSEQYFSGANQSEWKSWESWWRCYNHWKEQEQDHCNIWGDFSQKVIEISHQQVFEDQFTSLVSRNF